MHDNASDNGAKIWKKNCTPECAITPCSYSASEVTTLWRYTNLFIIIIIGWLGSRVASVLDSGEEGPGFKSQSRLCRVTVLV